MGGELLSVIAVEGGHWLVTVTSTSGLHAGRTIRSNKESINPEPIRNHPRSLFISCLLYLFYLDRGIIYNLISVDFRPRSLLPERDLRGLA